MKDLTINTNSWFIRIPVKLKFLDVAQYRNSRYDWDLKEWVHGDWETDICTLFRNIVLSWIAMTLVALLCLFLLFSVGVAIFSWYNGISSEELRSIGRWLLVIHILGSLVLMGISVVLLLFSIHVLEDKFDIRGKILKVVHSVLPEKNEERSELRKLLAERVKSHKEKYCSKITLTDE